VSLLRLLARLRRSRVRVEPFESNRIPRFLAALAAAALSFRILDSGATDLVSGRASDYASFTQHNSAKSLGESDQGIPESTRSNFAHGSGQLGAAPTVPIVADRAMSDESVVLTDIPLAGKTLDLTLFALVRAMDAIIQSNHKSGEKHSRRARLTALATPALFTLSSVTVMHAWFYSPYRLPQSYRLWISRAADLDDRLLEALRQARYGNFFYGKETGIAPLLGSLCKELGLPEEYGNPAQTIPVPCQLYHMGGKSCEAHAAWRFWKGFKFAGKVYAPLHASMLMWVYVTRRRLSVQEVMKEAISAGRSSAFLGTFIGLFYYGVCLARTRAGPKILSRKTVSPQMWDSGLCITSGGFLCGLSIFVEEARRRTELVLFVLWRSVTVWFPRRYDAKVGQFRSCYYTRTNMGFHSIYGKSI